MMTANRLCLGLAALCSLAFIDAGVAERVTRDTDKWIISTLVEPPYVKNKTAHPTKNEDYEGYIPDMLKEIMNTLRKTYELKVVEDGKYGKKTEGRGWNGMIGQVVSGHAHMAAAPITISEDRKDDVDFTKPFMTFGTVILIRKPNGSEPHIKDIHQLADQHAIQYGVVRDGMTESLFSTSKHDYIVKMKNKLETVDSQEVGVRRVRDGKYAFIIEANTADFWMKQYCELEKIKIDEFPERSYAFVFKKGSPDTSRVSEVIQKMHNDGALDKLKAKWWVGTCSGGSRLGGVTGGVATTAGVLLATLASLAIMI
jgi:ABC-type amino acid transport substrate-binding protein